MGKKLLALTWLVFLVPNLKAASADDNRIEASIQKTYVYQAYLKSDEIKVESSNGVVTLSGEVTDRAHKEMAEEAAAGLPGVKRVQNNIVSKGSLFESENSDGWISSKVQAAFLFHRNVSALNTNVAVKDGVVTLTGQAQTQAERDMATEFAKDIDGVKDVKNEMVVTGPPTDAAQAKQASAGLTEKIDDASITAQVKLSLMYHRSTSALNTTVNTDNGVVTLAGKARNPAEKDLVTQLVTNIKGVTAVNNNMVVAEDQKT